MPTAPLAVRRAAAFVVPLLLVLSGTGVASAAKPSATPPPVVLAMPEKVTKATGAAFAWTVEAGTAYTCSLDGSAFVTCASPQTYSGLAEGPHSWTVSAKLTGAAPGSTTYDWTVDTVAPAAPTVDAVPSPTNRTVTAVTFSAAEAGVTFTCSVDGRAPVACASPYDVAVSTEGVHTLAVVAVDAARNASPPGTRSWHVDLTAPGAPVLVEGPADHTEETAATVVFAGSDGTATSFTCSLDGAAETPCTTTWTASGLALGPHSLTVTAHDDAGNAGPPTTVATWTVDRRAWAPVITSGPAYSSRDSDPSFAFAASDIAATTGFRCSLDGAAEVPCASPTTASALAAGPLADGEHVLAVVAVDAGGATSQPATYVWTVDTQAPVAAPEAAGEVPAASGAVPSTPQFAFTTSDPSVAGFACSVDADPFTGCESPFQPAVADGDHTLVVVTVDQAGNQATAGLTYTWRLDTTAPAWQVRAPSALTSPATVSFTEDVTGVVPGLQVAGGAAVGARVACLAASGTTTSCTGPVRALTLTPLVRLVPGQRYAVTLAAGAQDAAGHPAALTSEPFRAPVAVEESDLAVGHAWASLSSTSALGGRYTAAQLGGATASYSFRGTSVTWYTATGPGMGTARVYCGSTLKATVSNYASRAAWRVPRTVTCSSTTASHVLKVVATGLKGSAAATGTRVVVDAVKVGATTYANPALSTRWRAVSATAASGGRYALGDLAGDTVSLVFRGTSVSLATVLGPTMGYARVYLDGVLVGTVDGYASAYRYGVVRTWSRTGTTPLADTVHTLRVVATGTHRAGAKGNGVAVDRITAG